ncbi:unnamed protein product [Linum tenue]|nr:unnamed protein product [Linum tenue]
MFIRTLRRAMCYSTVTLEPRSRISAWQGLRLGTLMSRCTWSGREGTWRRSTWRPGRSPRR